MLGVWPVPPPLAYYEDVRLGAMRKGERREAREERRRERQEREERREDETGERGEDRG